MTECPNGGRCIELAEEATALRAELAQVRRKIEKARDKYLAVDDVSAYEVLDDLLATFDEGASND